jgi:hypothetical protein
MRAKDNDRHRNRAPFPLARSFRMRLLRGSRRKAERAIWRFSSRNLTGENVRHARVACCDSVPWEGLASSKSFEPVTIHRHGCLYSRLTKTPLTMALESSSHRDRTFFTPML